MILAPTNRRIIRPHNKPSFEHTQRYGLIKGHPLGPAGGMKLFLISNEGSGNTVLDLSGNWNDGTFQGTAPSWSDGKFGPAVLLPGTNEYVRVDAAVVNAPPYTISVWVYPRDLTSYIPYFTISNGDEFIRLALRGDVAGDFAELTLDDDVGWSSVSTTAAYIVNQWNHVVVVCRSNTDREIFIHGGNSAVDNDDRSPAGLSEINIGGDHVPNAFSNVMVDLPMIYNRELSVAEINQVMFEPFCMVQKRTAPVYFFVPVGEVKELTGTVTIQSVVTGSIKVLQKLTGTVTIQSVVTGRLFTAGGFSNVTELRLLDHIVGKADFAKPTAYIGFCTADPGEEATGGDCNEVPNTNGYARIATAAGDWNSASGGAIDNANSLISPCASGGGWGTITHYILVDSPTYGEGNVLVYDKLDDPSIVEEGDNLEFAAGDLILELD